MDGIQSIRASAEAIGCLLLRPEDRVETRVPRRSVCKKGGTGYPQARKGGRGRKSVRKHTITGRHNDILPPKRGVSGPLRLSLWSCERTEEGVSGAAICRWN